MSDHTPTATELFIALWGAQLSRVDDAGNASIIGPGDSGFNELAIRDWVKTWADCLRMSEAISQHEMSK